MAPTGLRLQQPIGNGKCDGHPGPESSIHPVDERYNPVETRAGIEPAAPGDTSSFLSKRSHLLVLPVLTRSDLESPSSSSDKFGVLVYRDIGDELYQRDSRIELTNSTPYGRRNAPDAHAGQLGVPPSVIRATRVRALSQSLDIKRELERLRRKEEWANQLLRKCTRLKEQNQQLRRESRRLLKEQHSLDTSTELEYDTNEPAPDDDLSLPSYAHILPVLLWHPLRNSIFWCSRPTPTCGQKDPQSRPLVLDRGSQC